MPTLDWIGKDKVVNHHLDAPYHVLDKQYTFGADESENMIIHGDNLVALKALLPKYEGKIDCIYIDPPYNTGNEGWVYNDKVNDPVIKKWLGEVVGAEGEDLSRHDKWLCMMYPRLRLLQKLLSKTGSLIVSIGYHELNNLILICREMFSDKQIVPVTVQTSGGKPNGGFNYTQEYVVFIVPSTFSPNPSEDAMNEYSSPYHGMNLATFNQVQRPNQAYPIFVDKKGVIVGVGKSLQERVDAGEYVGELGDFAFDYSEAPEGCVAVWPVTSKGDPCVWRLISQRLISDWKAGFIKVIEQKNKKNKNQYTIQYLSEGIIKKIKNGELPCYRISNDPDVPTVEVEGYKTAGVNVPLIWSDKKNYTARGSDEIREIFGDKSAFNYPKPTNLIKTILKYVTSTDSVILDSFAGSGTTAHSVLELNKDDGGNRRFILVELGEYAEKITAERAKRIIKGYEGTESPVEGTGGSFSFYELGSPIILDDKINPDVPIETVKEFIYYLETKQAYKKDSDEKALLGVNSGCAYYFFYTPGKTVTLNRRKLSCIKTKAESYVIYADNCTLSDEELKNYNITFKKPGDIGRF